MSDARKPVVVLVVVGVGFVLLFVLGLALGDGSGSSRGWQARLSGFGIGGELSADDVSAGQGCEREGAAIVFQRGCVLEIAPRGGGLSLRSPVRSARLVNVSPAPVVVVMVVEGERIEAELAPRDDQDDEDEAALTFGPDGGTVAVQCLSLAACAVVLD